MNLGNKILPRMRAAVTWARRCARKFAWASAPANGRHPHDVGAAGAALVRAAGPELEVAGHADAPLAQPRAVAIEGDVGGRESLVGLYEGVDHLRRPDLER